MLRSLAKRFIWIKKKYENIDDVMYSLNTLIPQMRIPYEKKFKRKEK